MRLMQTVGSRHYGHIVDNASDSREVDLAGRLISALRLPEQVIAAGLARHLQRWAFYRRDALCHPPTESCGLPHLPLERSV